MLRVVSSSSVLQQKCVVGNDRNEKNTTVIRSIGIHQATNLNRSRAEQVFDLFVKIFEKTSLTFKYFMDSYLEVCLFFGI
jgi:hypothetical protein